MSYDVFISYARADNDKEGVSRFVEALGLAHRVLTGRELKVFFDRSEIHTAQDWELRLLESLRASRSMIALLSPAYLQSEYCRLEWSRFELHSALRLVVDQGIRPLVVVPVGDLELELAKAGPEVRRLVGPVQRGLLPLTDLLDSLTDEYLLERIALLKGDEGMGNPIEREIMDSIRWVQRLGERQAKSELSASHGFMSMNRRFVGRIAELRELRKALAECTEVAVSAEGVAGIGKSELANAYAHAFGWDYPAGRWFVPCEGQTDLPALLANTMASDLNIQLTPEDRREADGGFYRVRARLNALAPEARKVLVVLDNVDKDELVSTRSMRNLNVDADYFDVLVTSRRRLRSGNRDEYLRTVTLGRLLDEELRDLLGVGLTADAEEIQAAQTLIQNTGGLTLAIEIAGVYLRDNGIRIVDYVESLQDGALALIDQTSEEPGVANAIAHPEKVIERIFITAIEKLTPEQRIILAYAAQCHPDFIPTAWLEHLACAECPGLAERKLGKSAFERALKGLFDASLLEAPAGGSGRCRLHRLIKETIRRMPDWDTTRADLFRDLISEVLDLEWYDSDSRIQPLDIAAWLGLQSGDDRKLVWLIRTAGILCQYQGFYREGEALMRRALEARERILGPEHPKTLNSVNNLANLLRDKGDLAGAEPLYRRALEARERILGPEHPDTLASVNNLANLLSDKGDLAGAEPLYRRALEAQERILGPEHPDTLNSVNNLAILLKDKGDLAGAEPLYRRALEARERILGPEHPDTLNSVNNLAVLLKTKGDLAGAEPLYRRALEAQERILGPEHPNTLNSVNNLANLLSAKGDLAGAEPLYRRALEARERILGPEHPKTLGSVNNLADFLRSKGDLAGAEPLMAKATEIAEKIYGNDGDLTLSLTESLAELRNQIGQQGNQ